MKTYTVDCRAVRSFEDFIEAFNAGFVQPVGGTWHWGGNLDAFNDFLSWPGPGEYELEVIGAGSCAEHLDHAAQAAWLRATLGTCHPSHVPELRSRLTQAEAGKGETLFDALLEIVAHNPRVRLVLR